MKRFLFCVLTIVAFFFTQAQHQFNCSSQFLYEESMRKDPVFRKNQELLEQETQALLKNMGSQKTMSTATYVIPVVFHIIHTGTTGNISDAQIIDQVNILNKEFRRLQADTALTPPAFKSLAAAFDVEFRLATKDPSGNCTNGINRIYSSLATCSFGWDDVKTLSYWPSNQYLNLWIVESMHYPGSTACNGGGYSVFPGGAAASDGIVMRGDLIGSIGTAATNSGWGNFFGRYLIHELGHWFNLRHIWGDTNCGNDLVSDTPPALTSNSGCPSFPHNPNNSCGSNANGEMFTNYMDYTTGSCLNMFSAGQVVRMTAAINSAISGRNNLWSASNLSATGTADPYVYPASCVAVPQILPYTPIIACEGDSVKFTDYSYGGNSTSRQWDFFGQPASSLTDSIVKVKYSAAGVYNVALTKNYMSSTITQTFTNKVHILPATPNLNYIFPFTESFEIPGNFIGEWTVVNRDENINPVTWQTFTNTAFTGSYCVGINNSANIAPAVDELYSPTYSLTAAATATLSFRVHYTQKATSDYDKLLVAMSSNCGKTWTNLYSKNAAMLKTSAALNGADYYPTSQSEWRKESIDLSFYLPANEMKFRFSFTSGGGNNIFIDDINLQGDIVGIEENKQTERKIKLYPNPAENVVNILIESSLANNATLEVTNVLGNIILKQNIKSGLSPVDLNNFANGIYFVTVKEDNKIIYSTKLIKQGNE